GRSGAAARRITRQRKAKACGVEWARMSDSKWDCSSPAKVTWGARGTGIVEILMTREMAKHDMTRPQFYMLSTSKVLAQDLRNGHLGAFAKSPHPRVDSFPVLRLLCPFRLPRKVSDFHTALAFLLPPSLS